MKYLLSTCLSLISASVALGWQFAAPDLTRVHNTYEISGTTFHVIVSKDLSLSLNTVCLQHDDKKLQVPLEDLKDIAWPYLDKIVVTKEKDTIYVKITYGQELPGIKNHLQQASFEFKNDVYVSRERIVPTKQVFTDESIETTLEHYRKLPGEEEKKFGTGGITETRK